MEATLVRANQITPMTTVLSHNGESVIWQCKMYQSVLKNLLHDPFKQINGYWRQLPFAEQDDIFNRFKEIKNIFNNANSIEDIIRQMQSPVVDLLEIHNKPSLETWLRFHGNTWMPSGLQEVYVPRYDVPGSREQTYLRGDYWDLVVMATIFRTMVPIWGEFVERTKKESLPAFKEDNAFNLITPSPIFHCPAMDRLRTYIDKNIHSTEPDKRMGIEGIGSDDLRPWLLSLVCVKAVAIGDLERNEHDSTLFHAVYKIIHNKIGRPENSQNGVMEKTTLSSGEDGDNNTAKLEGYQNKEPVAKGPLVAMEVYSEDPYRMARRLDPTIDLALVKQSLASTECLLHEVPLLAQDRLVRSVIKPVFSPKAYLESDKTVTVRLTAVAQAVLWSQGYKEFAALVSAVAVNEEDLVLQGNGKRLNIKKETVEELNRLFPYQRRFPGDDKSTKATNPSIVAIGEICQELSDYSWSLTLPDAWVAELQGNALNRVYRPGLDLRPRLAELTIYMQMRNKEFHNVYQHQQQ